MACLSQKELAELPATTRVLEMGCGQVKHWPHSVAIDINPRSIADVIHDLNVVPYPFEDNSFDIVIAEHVIEHLDDVIKVIEETHRILKPGGLLYIEVPHFSSNNHFTDPTHKHAFSSRSLDYFVPAAGGVYMFHYSTADFNKRDVTINGPMDNAFLRFINKHSNSHKVRFERDFAFIFPRETINFVMEVIK